MELEKSSAPEETLRRGNLLFRPSHHRVWLMDGNPQEIALTRLEFRLLYYFASHEAQVLTREQVREAVWGDRGVADRTIDTHISNLRKKILCSDYEFRAVHGVGYEFRKKVDGRFAS